MKKFYVILLVIMLSLKTQAQWVDNGSSLNTSDNVGIGTTETLQKLNVKRNTSIGSWESLQLGNAVMSIQDADFKMYIDGNSIFSNGDILIGAHNSSAVTFGTNSLERLRIESDGNIGIGTTETLQKLNVKRNTSIGGWGNLQLGNAVMSIQDADFKMYIDGNSIFSNGDMLIGAHNSSAVTFGTNSLERLRIESDGNIGIGTTTPDYKLDVTGTIRACEVKVDIASGECPDYVFSDDYDLMKLDELESYINENSHLPEIKSASEMETEGMNLKEMNVKLLKKMEEMTLYMIEMNKEIKVLKEKNAELGKNMKSLQ